jgi:3-polyprenyl-4-hydroxybenzoate decarboxylase
MKHLKSLRAFIEDLKEIGEIQEIDQEVDWNLEMSGITRHSMELRASAPLFNHIKGIDGFRVMGAPRAPLRLPEPSMVFYFRAFPVPAKNQLR